MFYIYVLKSQTDRKFYVGYTSDLRKRLKYHNAGKVLSTENRGPLELVYYEAFKYERDAREQELFYKTGQGRRILKSRLKSVIEENNFGRFA